MDDLVRRVRELHRPHWFDPYERSGQVWLICRGCDEGAHSESPPQWPCGTAEIVYTTEEITMREPAVPECTADHGVHPRDGTPYRPQAVFLRPSGGQLVAARWNCDHVQPVPVMSNDPW
jgi:hypothetical protein